MKYIVIPVTKFLQNCSLVWCSTTKLAVLIDPGGNIESIKQNIISFNLKLTKILLTHGHIDHVAAATELAKYYDVMIFGPNEEDKFLLKNLSIQSRIFDIVDYQPVIPNHWLNEGDVINTGNINLQVLHCPGHTPGHIVYYEDKFRLLISGDIIFKGSLGRSDFPHSDYHKLVNSIKQKLLPLGDNVKFIPGHGQISTLGFERMYNPFLQ